MVDLNDVSEVSPTGLRGRLAGIDSVPSGETLSILCHGVDSRPTSHRRPESPQKSLGPADLLWGGRRGITHPD